MLIRMTTTGRRSGNRREVTLYAFPDGDGLVVTGSWAGATRDPDWVLNLRSEPEATVRFGRADRPVRAREAHDDERERLWRLVCQGFPMYETYQRRTSRRFPLFALEPRDGPDVR